MTINNAKEFVDINNPSVPLYWMVNNEDVCIANEQDDPNLEIMLAWLTTNTATPQFTADQITQYHNEVRVAKKARKYSELVVSFGENNYSGCPEAQHRLADIIAELGTDTTTTRHIDTVEGHDVLVTSTEARQLINLIEDAREAIVVN